ncbi:MAG: hypothetical protein K2X47_10835, partial [Bdellovibrionales bacterium]|nr:hypothetical protein [Bdellovibrionales bacterium]
PPDDPKLCQDLGGGITRQKCLDAAANNPFLTVGTAYRQTFNHHQVTLDEATVFAYRASIQASCGEQIMRDIMSDVDGQKLAREAFVAARAYPVDSITPPPPIPRTSNFWGHVYIALKLGAITDVEAGRAFEGAPGGHLNVSSGKMNQLMTTFSAGLTAAGSCAALRTAIINP